MRKLFIFALAGFLAQLVDGSLGMGFGASSSSILLTFGVAPAIVSATVHFSEIATTAASGTSHWKFENVHYPTMLKLAIPGAAVLTRINANAIKPLIALFLLSMGVYILYQFIFKHTNEEHHYSGQFGRIRMVLQGAIAGFLDAIGGGGWGPVNTPLLLSSKKMEPRYVIGTVSASEFFVTLSASLSFIVFLGMTHINWLAVIALSVGGLIAAPISAYLVKILPINILAICVGGLIIFTNSNALLSYFVEDEVLSNIVRVIIIVVVLSLLVNQVIRNRILSFSYNKSRVNKYN